MGGSNSSASWLRVSSGLSSRSRAASDSLSGRASSPGRRSSRRMASICSWAASTALVRLAESQFTRRFTPLRRCFSALAFITSMAARGAPMAVRKSSMDSLCLK